MHFQKKYDIIDIDREQKGAYIMEKGFFEKVNKGKPYLPYIARNQKVFHYLPHYHAETEIVFMKAGKTALTVDGNCIELTCGEIYVVSPNKIHSFRSVSKSDLYIMKLYTPSSLLDFNLNVHIRTENPLYAEMAAILNDMIREAEAHLEGREIAMTLHANRFLLMLIRKFSPPKQSDFEKTKDRKSIEISSRILDYFENHYAEDISLEDLADSCGYSRYSLSHAFKELTTSGFYELLASFRIEKSKELLKKKMGVLDAAMACGFNNQRSFNRNFKQFVGMTPTEFIRLIDAQNS